MNIDLIFKMGAVGMLLAILNIILSKAGREDYAMLTTFLGVTLALVVVAKQVNELFETVKSMFYLY